jgi:hypothetical protein
METSTRLLVAAALLTALGIYGAVRKPYGTLLPMDVSDLSGIQPKLDKLGSEERELALGYLERSNGDVLPPSLADPDAPFTARTFGEAIELQRRFLREQGVRDAQTAQRRAAREQALEPLREAVGVRLVRRELLTTVQAMGLQDAASSPTGTERVLVVTYRLVNGSGRDIARTKGSVEVIDPDGRKRSECWFDESRPLEAFSAIEVRCGNTARSAGASERDFVALPAQDLRLTWEPAEVVFADGTRLSAPR